MLYRKTRIKTSQATTKSTGTASQTTKGNKLPMMQTMEQNPVTDPSLKTSDDRPT